MWTCPECKAAFRNPHQWHSCGDWSVEGYLKDRPDDGVAVYRLLEKALMALPDVDVRPVKTRILFRGPTAFASVEGIGKGWVDVTFALPRTADHPLLRRVVRETGDLMGHVVRVASDQDLADVMPLLQEALETVGRSGQGPDESG